MEDHDNENVILVLDNQRFEVNKKKLINKSQYFAVYFSRVYTDYNLSEHCVLYNIPEISFQDFNNWINSDEPNVIIDAENMNVGRLLTLLNLSNIYEIKDEFNLTETIVDIFQNRKLTLQDALNAWLMAKNLNLKILRDLYFSVCLDRFTELPLNLICELSKENFLQLIENTNLRIPKGMDARAYLSIVVQEWMEVNQDTIPLNNLEITGPKLYQSIIYHHKENDVDNDEFHLHCWDGEKSFKLATFFLPEELINNKNQIEGMEIIARGHNLYFIGGEFLNGGSQVTYNKKVWRYSLITKNWYFETTMPHERRQMIAAFVQNKLLLAGGWDSNHQKLKSLDIYDVHKGTWTEGMNMPITYLVPFGCFNVVDKNLICFSHRDLKSIYIYNSEINYWCKIENKNNSNLQHLHDPYMTAVIKQFKTASFHFDMVTRDRVNLKSIVCNNSEYKQKFYEKYAEYLQIEEKYKEESNFDMYFCFIDFWDNEMYDYYVLFCSKNENVDYKLIHWKREHLPWRSVPIQNLNAFQSPYVEICSTMFSNLMDPADLYQIDDEFK